MNDNGKLTLFLMRHGETILNKAERTQGWSDGVLTSEGREVAVKAGIGLSDTKFKCVYSSDLGRAVKTASIVIEENKVSENLKLIQLESLREVYFGKYEAEKEYVMMNDILKYLNIKSFEEVYKLKVDDFQKSFCNACAALDETNEAEDYNTALNRVMDALKSICKTNYESDKDSNILLVIHGGILRLIIDYLDKSFNLRHIDNASISKITYDGKNFKVISVNDTSIINIK